MPLHDRNNLPAPLVFVQYIVSLAMVEAIRSFDSGFEDFPVKLKWPNDVYCENPDFKQDSKDEDNLEFYKVGGLLINSNVLDNQYVLVAGLGVNVSNYAPSISLNTIVNKLNSGVEKTKNLPPLDISPLKNYLLNTMLSLVPCLPSSGLWALVHLRTCTTRDGYIQTKLSRWSSTTMSKPRLLVFPRITGMLIVEEVDRNNKPIGKTYELQPDGNSFDMMKGLLKKKA